MVLSVPILFAARAFLVLFARILLAVRPTAQRISAEYASPQSVPQRHPAEYTANCFTSGSSSNVPVSRRRAGGWVGKHRNYHRSFKAAEKLPLSASFKASSNWPTASSSYDKISTSLHRGKLCERVGLLLWHILFGCHA